MFYEMERIETAGKGAGFESNKVRVGLGQMVSLSACGIGIGI